MLSLAEPTDTPDDSRVVTGREGLGNGAGSR